MPAQGSGSSSKRVVFTFDERSLKTLEDLTGEIQAPSMAETVREALRVMQTLVFLTGKGYTDVVARNPDSGAEQIVISPVLRMPDRN